MRRIITLISSLLLGVVASAQTYPMSATPITTCSGNWYDSGGAGGNYGNSQNITQTFTSSTGDRLSFLFNAFTIETCCDRLYIYDGPNTAYPLIGIYTSNPGTIVSTGTSLTFVFTSDGSQTYAGWDATISCTTAPLTNYNLTAGTVTACQGNIFDNGGSAANYSDNVDITQTFCSGTSDYLQFSFLTNATNLTAGDTLFIYDGATTLSPLIGAFITGSRIELFTSSGTCVTLRFKSNASGNASGWAGSFACTSVPPSPGVWSMTTGIRGTCGGTFYDAGGTGNYPNNENRTQTFVSANGNRLEATFTSFAVETCCDRLYIYDGPTNAHPLIGVYTSNPGTITATGTALTFTFTSDGSNTSTGWVANFSCTTAPLTVYPLTPGTVTACSGFVSDNGGPTGIYSNNANITQTFTSGSSDFLNFQFWTAATALVAGDTLWVYDGATTSAPLIGAYTGGSTLESFTSTGNSVTFRFVSNNANVSGGWAGWFICTTTPATPGVYSMSSGIRGTCGGTFYDAGGVGNYPNNENRTQSFISANGNRLQATFTSFAVETCCDRLYIYDGPNSSYPLIGVYTSNPGTITASGTALTFTFTSDGSNTNVGWVANISCTTAPLTVYPLTNGTVTACSGFVCDNGGPNGIYSNNANITQTFNSGSGDFLNFQFWTAATGLVAGDTLWIYDGAITSAPLIGAYTAGSTIESFTSTGNSVTFRFVSNNANVAAGWAGWFSCTTTPATPGVYSMSSGIRGTCGGTFYDAGGGGNYPNNENRTQSFISTNGNRLQATFTSFAVETCCDRLYIYDGPNNAYPLIGVYTSNPGTVTSTGTALTFTFTSDGSNTSTGWVANISCTTAPLTVYPLTNGTVTACSGFVCDNGGPSGIYSNNANITQTFTSGSGDFLNFQFWTAATSIVTGDTLWVYDGTGTSSPLIGAYTNGSTIESFTSTGNSVTFRFVSDNANVLSGWAGWFTCTTTPGAPLVFNMSSGIRGVCNATFYDAGGPGGNYPNNENRTQTFVSTNGERLQAVFSSFGAETCCDRLYIYDGPTTSYPLLGIYTSSPGTVTSSGTSLTFRFTSDGATTSSGWNAALSCAGPVLPVYSMSSGTVVTCGGVFYDAGGPNANYPNNENRTMTFTSASGQYLQFAFNGSAFGIDAGDSLFVYDGATTSAPPLAIYTGYTGPGTVTSNTPSLTFRFKSSSATTAQGWQAWITCVNAPNNNPQFNMTAGVIYTCGGNFYDSGGASGGYPNNEYRTMTFYSNSGCGIRFTFTAFNTESCCDRLYVYDGPSTASPLIGQYAGNALPPVLQSSGSCLTFRFTSDGSVNGGGWAATISCPTQPLATITASGSTNLCQGDSVVLTAANNTSYSWNTGATTQSITVGANGSYWCTVANASGCVATSAITYVSVNPVPTPSISASGPTTFCQGDDVVLTASGGGTYLWSNGSTQSSITVTASGNYSVTATDANGCSATTSATNVTVNPSPAALITASGPLNICSGDNVTLTASGGTSYAWTTGATTSSITVSQAGTYNVLATNSSGCTDSANAVTVNVFPVPVAAVSASGPTTFCQGNSVTLTASGGTSYLWSDGSTGTSVVVNTSGNYYVIASNAPGCSDTSAAIAVTVNPTPVPSITASGSLNLCSGDSVTLTASGGTSYLWSTGATSPSITVDQPGSYSVVASNASGCTSSAGPMNVNVFPAPVAGVSTSGPTTFCQGNSVTLTASGGTSYLWSDGSTGPTLLVTGSGNYYVVASTTSGCTDTSSVISVVVNPTPAPAITASGALNFCAGDSVVLTASGGTSYLWSDNATTSSITVTQSGTYSVVASNASGCSASAGPVTVNVYAAPVAAITPSGATTFCQGNGVTLNASGGTGYLWSDGSTASSIYVTTSGTYSVIAYNPAGCSDTSANTTVTVHALPVVSVSLVQDTFCIFDPLFTLGNASPLGGSWSGNGVSGNMFDPMVAGAGTHTITYIYTDSNSCFNAAAQNVYVDICTGTPVVDSNTELAIYPNPASDIVYLAWNAEFETIVIRDVTGRVVFNATLTGEHSLQVDVSHFASGHYSVEFTGATPKSVPLIINR